MRYFYPLKRTRLSCFLLCIFIFLFSINGTCQQIYKCNNGFVEFKSIAAQELIKASSKSLAAVISTKEKTFAFIVRISSFEGFNATLQREHFNERYMESDLYPEASFKGKIIEEVDLAKEGMYEVRAKGILKIHNVEQERIIKGMIKVGREAISIKSDFNVILKDHLIKVPKVVHEKIATEIDVIVEAELHPAN